MTAFGKLLRYSTVREMFGWRSNFMICKYANQGKLTRVHLGNGVNSYRITEQSALALLASLTHHNDAEEKAELARAAAQTALRKKSKRLPLPDGGEVLIDPQEVIANYNAGLRALRPPVQKPTLEEALQEQSAAAPVPVRPDWRERNRWIEGGCIGPDPWRKR